MDFYLPNHLPLILDGKPAHVRNPAGFIFADGKEVASTLQCVHCQAHWIVVRGSGKKRGWCLNCNGPHCGGEKCWTCRPAQQRLEDEEKAYRLSLP